MSNLNEELHRFWSWAKMTPQDYAVNRGNAEWETEYPEWELIYSATKKLIDNFYQKNTSIKKKELLNDLLEALAIDNEAEIILQYIEGNHEITDDLIDVGYNYYQPQARWQIAELLKRQKKINKKAFLIKMIDDDDDKYVQRRALLAFYQLFGDEAIIFANKKINDNDEILRRVSKEIIEEISQKK